VCTCCHQRAFARHPRLTVRTARNFQTIRDQTCWPAHPTPGVNRGYADGQLRDDGTLRTVTAVGGATIYRGDLFPAEFRGNAFVPEPAGNLVKRLVLHEEGGVVTATNAYEGREFLTSTDERFRPVHAYTGPDGALYVVDMGRGVIQHRFFLTHYLLANIAERRLEGPLRTGRIWRIVPTGVRPAAVKLPRETAAIVPLLAHANGQVRDQAQRVLCERGDASVVEAVQRLAAEAPSPLGRVHALWTLEGLDGLTDEVVERAPARPRGQRACRSRAARGPFARPEVAGAGRRPECSGAAAAGPAAGFAAGDRGCALDAARQGPDALVRRGDRQRHAGSRSRVRRTPAVPTGLAGPSHHFLRHRVDAGSVRDGRAARRARGDACSHSRPSRSWAARASWPCSRAWPEAHGRIDAGKQIVLDAAPAALAKLAASATGPARDLVLRLDAQLSWNGKAGAVPPPAIVPLTVAEQVRFDRGKVLYGALCATCHQPTGTGLAGLAPPLVDSEWVLGPADRLARIVLHGLTGPVPVAGTVWQLEMPPLGSLGDEELAATSPMCAARGSTAVRRSRLPTWRGSAPHSPGARGPGLPTNCCRRACPSSRSDVVEAAMVPSAGKKLVEARPCVATSRPALQATRNAPIATCWRRCRPATVPPSTRSIADTATG
jgi:mono/diheme cytochrome c family protein